MHRSTLIAGVLVVFVGGGLQQPVLAQSRESREHTQILADLRMLQEQQQKLQVAVNQLAEALKATNAALAAQTADATKGLAGVRAEIASINQVLPQLRSLLDQTRVDVGRVGPEIDALREALRISLKYSAQIIEMLQPVDPLAVPNPAAGGGGGAPTGPPPTTAAQSQMPDSPATYFNAGNGYYASGDYKSAIESFEQFLKLAPSAADAPFAQLQIGRCHSQLGDHKAALVAFKEVTEKYKGTDQVPEAYYSMGMTYERLNNLSEARSTYRLVANQYKGTVAAIRAEQRLQAIK
jgi:TolA-binding protein